MDRGAEFSERFPRKLIEHLGQSGVFAHKWCDGQHPDDEVVSECMHICGGADYLVDETPIGR